MSKLCVTCEKSIQSLTDKLFSQDENIIPDWFKEIGNYSLLPPPLNRNNKYNLFKKKRIQNIFPDDYDCVKNIDTQSILPKIKNRWVFYWASERRDYSDTSYPQPALAYSKFENCGISLIDSDYNLTFKFRNPTPYQYENTKYPPHLHFVYLDKNKLWNTDCHTLIITPEISYTQFNKILQSNKYLVICSIPNKININEIKGTLRLSSEFSKQRILNEIRKFTPTTYINHYGKYTDIPIVIYGKNNKSKCSDKLIDKLRSLEFINIIKFSGGLDRYFKKS